MVESGSSSPTEQGGEEKHSDISELERRLNDQRMQLARSRVTFILSVAILLFSFFLLIFPEVFIAVSADSYWDSSKKDRWIADNLHLARLIGMILLVLCTTGFAYLYTTDFQVFRLRRKPAQGGGTTAGERFDDAAMYSIVDTLKTLNHTIEKGALESVLSERERNDIIEKLSGIVKQQLNETLLASIEQKYGLQVRNEKISHAALEKSEIIVDRLKNTGVQLQSKANIYLFYGMFAAVFGLGIFSLLIYTVSIPENISSVGEAFYYTSRITLVLLIEAFAFFFFNLYRATLGDIKFMTNEITNAETKIIALASALKLGDNELMKEVVAEFGKAERNFVLKKGETSIFHDVVGSRLGAQHVIEQMFEKLRSGTGKQQ